MDNVYAIEAASEALKVTLLLSAPAMLVALIVGLTISLVQATTQIQEQSLTFVPKLVGVFLVLMLTGAIHLEKLIEFATYWLEAFPDLIK